MSGMSSRFASGLVLLVLVLAVVASPPAQIPRKINYQGKLTDSGAGLPLPGSQEMTFRVYDDPDAGSLLWSESQTVPVDDAGVFSVLLGDVTPVDIDLDGPVWLEVEVGGETLSPRRELVSVPFALRTHVADHALDADLLVGLDASAFADTGHAHDDRYCTRDSLSAAGTLNDPSNPVEWTRLKNVPAGFADGIDDGGGAGDGHSLDAVDGYPTDVVFVDSEGRVGIGTTAPVAGRLAVIDSAGTLVWVYSEAGTSIKATSLSGTAINGYSETGLAGHFSGPVLVGGNVGIGTWMPDTELNVDGRINVSLGYSVAGSTVVEVTDRQSTHLGLGAGPGDTSSYCTFVGSNAGYANDEVGNTFVGSEAGASSVSGGFNTMLGAFAGSNTASGRLNTFLGAYSGIGNLTGTGNTCIGTYSYFLPSSGNENTMVGCLAGEIAGGSGNVFIGYAAGAVAAGSDQLYIANGSADEDVLIYGDFAAGTLGLGTLDPEEKLHVEGDNPRILVEARTSNPEINLKSAGDPEQEVWALYKETSNDDLYFYQNGDIRLALKNSTGNVGIGTHNTGSYKLYVEGEAYATLGWTPSDRRFKQELGGIDDPLEKVLGLRGVRFRWRTEDYAGKGFPEGEHYGLIAQDTEQVMPEIVRAGPEGAKAIAYGEIIPVLVESVRALKAENDALRERIAALEQACR